MLPYPKEMPYDEVIRNVVTRIAYDLYKARGFGRPDEDWNMAWNIVHNKEWFGSGRSYAQIIKDYKERNP